MAKPVLKLKNVTDVAAHEDERPVETSEESSVATVKRSVTFRDGVNPGESPTHSEASVSIDGAGHSTTVFKARKVCIPNDLNSIFRILQVWHKILFRCEYVL